MRIVLASSLAGSVCSTKSICLSITSVCVGDCHNLPACWSRLCAICSIWAGAKPRGCISWKSTYSGEGVCLSLSIEMPNRHLGSSSRSTVTSFACLSMAGLNIFSASASLSIVFAMLLVEARLISVSRGTSVSLILFRVKSVVRLVLSVTYG